MPIVRRLASWRPALVAFCLVALSGGMARAAEWTAASVRGTVLFLQADTWQELPTGESLPGPTTLRTLGSGRLTMESDGVAFALGGGALVRLDPQTPGPAIAHLAGTLVFAVNRPGRLVISTPGGSVTVAGARGRITLSGQRAVIMLEAGTAAAVLLDGNSIELAAGDTAELDSNGAARVSTGKPEQPGTGKPADTPGQGNSGNAGSGNSGNGSGQSNAGGNSENTGNNSGKGASSKDSTTSQGKGSGVSSEKSNNGKKGD